MKGIIDTQKVLRRQQEHSNFLQNIFSKLNTPQDAPQSPSSSYLKIEKNCYFHSQLLEAPPISTILQKANSVSEKISDLKEGSFFITEHFKRLLLDLEGLKEYIDQAIYAKKGNYFNSRFTTILCEIISKKYAGSFNFQQQRFKKKFVIWLTIQKMPICYYHSNKDQKVDCKKKISMKLLSEFLPSFSSEINKGDCIGFVKHYLDSSQLHDILMAAQSPSIEKTEKNKNVGKSESRKLPIYKKAKAHMNKIRQQKQRNKIRVMNTKHNRENSSAFKAKIRMEMMQKVNVNTN